MTSKEPVIIHLKLESTDGCVGTGTLAGLDLVWNREPESHTAQATLSIGTDQIVIAGDAWRALESEGDFQELHATARYAGLESALREQLDVFESTYQHCGTEWTEEWSCDCNGECPVCGKGDIESVSARQLRGLIDSDRLERFELMEPA
jgi:hypothetical protein